MENTKPGLLTLCISLATGIALGALGAHGLNPLMDDNQQDIWEKAVFYQLINTVALIALNGRFNTTQNKLPRIGRYLIFNGLILFSGTLYLLATRHLVPWPAIKLIGVLTPVGGVLMITGWVMTGIGLKGSSSNH
jgi:uncharacterized membrane protein YgdD (TMEM256/DUF423 family)